MKQLYLIVILLIFPGFITIAQNEFSGDEKSLQNTESKESIYDFNPSSKWVRELKNVIIVPPKKEAVDSFNIQSPERIYFNTEGLTISAIKILRLKPFGTSVTDSVARNVHFSSKAANAMHISSNELIIRNALMFKEGDLIESVKLAYSERYLRSLKYINDVRIITIPVSDDEVEVIVAVQDIFPYSASFNSNFKSNADFAIINSNIIGLGIEMQAGAFFDYKKDHLMGYKAMLHSANLGRSFIAFQADYTDKYENQRYGFSLKRNFFSPTTKYAGHLIFYDSRTQVHYYDPKGEYQQITPISIRYNQSDVWFARSFQVIDKPMPETKHTNYTENISRNKTPTKISEGQLRNLTASIRVQRLYFTDRPEDSEERFYRFQNRTTFLASVSWSYQTFYKASMIYNFGRTEDIPNGDIITITGGGENNEKYVRPYIGANYSTGYFVPDFGYISGAFSIGNFFRNGNADQGIIDLKMNYITNLCVAGNYRMRTFLNGQYTGQLFNRLEDRLLVDGEFGIPGFRNDSILGQHRFNLSVEQNWFIPHSIYEFRFVFFAFVYFSWIGDYNTPIVLSPLYSSFGIGLRMRNNRMIFKTLQVRLAYFPNIPNRNNFDANMSAESVLKPRDFQPVAPEVLPLY